MTEEEMMQTMTQIMDGLMPANDMANFLTTLADRGETVDEIVGAARVLRSRARTIKAPPDSVDCCGTGGDGLHTYNISTAVALVAAACGVPVAKHGNRAASSKSGAADVLEALGVNLSITPRQAEEALRQINFTFLMAPQHHEAMKHVAPVRKQLGRKTIFNLLGPLANPGMTKRQLIGVYDKKWIEPMAQALKRLGTERAWVVHGRDGMDEISITGPTQVAVLDQDQVSFQTLTPDDFGLPAHKLDDLRGGDVSTNAAALRGLLEGKKSAYRDAVLANTAAVLVIHGSSYALKDATGRAAQAIDSGAARKILEAYKSV